MMMDVRVKLALQGGHLWEFCCDRDDPIVFGLVSALPSADVSANLPPDGLVQVQTQTGERLFLTRSSLVSVEIVPIPDELRVHGANRVAGPSANLADVRSGQSPFLPAPDALPSHVRRALMEHAPAQDAPASSQVPAQEKIRERMKVVFDWGVSSYYGWGVCGLNLALEWAKYASVEATTLVPLDLSTIVLDPLRKHALEPFIQRSLAREVPRDAIRLHALGNEFLSESDAPIGVIVFEKPLSKAAIERAKHYDLIVTHSTWNEELLRDHGLDNVRMIFEGVDPSLFYPAPQQGLLPGKFLIFSGGKAEPRKGQDIVVKAFRIFAQRHADAMLITAWHSKWPRLAAGMNLDLGSFADRVIDVGTVPNAHMPAIYRECDVSLFPNRAEGGTNLVAMECLACGVPTILSANSGHLDLIGRAGVFPLQSQQLSANGWGESDVEEILAALEFARNASADVSSPLRFNPTTELTWAATTSALTVALREHARCRPL